MTEVERLEGVFLAMSNRSEMGEIIEDGPWTLLSTPDAKTEYRNGVLRAHLEPETVEPSIAAALARFGDTPFRWHVGPSCTPKDLGQRLLDRGFVHADSMEGLLATNSALLEAPAPELVVEEILGEGQSLKEWLMVTRDAWSMTDDAIARFLTEMQVEFGRKEAETFYFLVRVDGRAVGSSVLTIVGSTGHLSGSCVLPAFRGRGAYRAMLRARARVLASHQVERVTVIARAATAAPILHRLGFRKVTTMEIYAHRPSPSVTPPRPSAVPPRRR